MNKTGVDWTRRPSVGQSVRQCESGVVGRGTTGEEVAPAIHAVLGGRRICLERSRLFANDSSKLRALSLVGMHLQ